MGEDGSPDGQVTLPTVFEGQGRGDETLTGLGPGCMGPGPGFLPPSLGYSAGGWTFWTFQSLF